MIFLIINWPNFVYLLVDHGFLPPPLPLKFLWSIALRPPIGWTPLTDRQMEWTCLFFRLFVSYTDTYRAHYVQMRPQHFAPSGKKRTFPAMLYGYSTKTMREITKTAEMWLTNLICRPDHISTKAVHTQQWQALRRRYTDTPIPSPQDGDGNYNIWPHECPSISAKTIHGSKLQKSRTNQHDESSE